MGKLSDCGDSLEEEKASRVIIISTDVHLRRVAFALGKVFRGKSVEFLYCPIPPRLASLRKETWWTRPEDRRFVLREMIKLAGYRVILSMLARIAYWIMRLKYD